MKHLNGGRIVKTQIQRVGPRGDDVFQFGIDALICPQSWSKLDGISPIGGSPRRSIIQKKIFVVSANNRPAVIDHDLRSLIGTWPKIDHISCDNDLVYIILFQVGKYGFECG